MHIRKDFHTNIAKSFIDDVQYGKSSFYYFLGRIFKWNETDETPEIDISCSEDREIRDNIFYIKKLSSNDTSLVCKRYDWSPGVFAKWDHTKNLTDENYYCITTENRVYKCLDNSAGLASSVGPTGTDLEPSRLADGYIWKYMYSISDFKMSKFATVDFIPVQNALSDSFYNKGSIDYVVVNNGGSNYGLTNPTTISVSDTTVGSGASISIDEVSGIGTILSLTITDGGTGYTKGARITVTSAGGTNAILTPVITAGVITDVTITSGGTGYLDTDTINVEVGGAILIPQVSTSGEILGVTIYDEGIGYNTDPVLTVTCSGASGLYNGNSTAIIKAIVDDGVVVRTTIEDPGQDYLPNDTAIISVTGDGTGAAFTPVLYEGEIIDVVIDNPGENYNTISLAVAGDGSNAVLTAIIKESDFISDQSVIEQATTQGAIYSIEIEDGGNDYSIQTTIEITGDGEGCEAELEIDSGVIVAINVTSFGSGYTQATVTITDPVSGNGAVVYPILSPIGGHGSNAIKELNGNIVCFTTFINNFALSENFEQEFRQIGIIKNPLDRLTTVKYSKHDEYVHYKMLFESVVNLEVDEILIINTYRYVVSSIDEDYVYLQALHNNNIIPTGAAYIEGEPLREYNSLSLVSSSSFDKYSGELLYTNNLASPISFTDEQGIFIRSYFNF